MDNLYLYFEIFQGTLFWTTRRIYLRDKVCPNVSQESSFVLYMQTLDDLVFYQTDVVYSVGLETLVSQRQTEPYLVSVCSSGFHCSCIFQQDTLNAIWGPETSESYWRCGLHHNCDICRRKSSSSCKCILWLCLFFCGNRHIQGIENSKGYLWPSWTFRPLTYIDLCTSGQYNSLCKGSVTGALQLSVTLSL